jgi:hypothetical protein
MPLHWPRHRTVLPDALVRSLGPDEEVQVVASLIGGEVLATSRFGLWVVSGEAAVRWNWERVSKARLSARTLTLTAADEIGRTDAGIVVLKDLPPRDFVLSGTNGLTDAVHSRVRRSVAASRHLPWPGAGGWVVLRRVPGQDGLTSQVRIDPGADVNAAGFLVAVADTLADLEAELVSS